MFNFRREPKKTPKEHAREVKKEMRKGTRDMGREIRDLERTEAKCTADIKKMAKAGNKAGLRTLAKQLVQIRKQKAKLQGMSSQLNAVGTRATVMASSATVAGAMKTATAAMAAHNAELKKADVAGTMREFARQSEHMGLTEELMDDALADAFDDDSEEEDEVVSSVLAEVGFDISSRMERAPAAGAGVAAPVEATGEDAAVAAVLREALGS